MLSSATLRASVESALGEHLSSTLLLREKVAPLTVSTGVAALDALTGGWPRGALSEITGPASSGRTGVMLAALAGATRRDEACALVDASDNFDPASAAAAGVDLDRLLWVRCNERDRSSPRKDQRRAALGRLEQVLKVTDLLLQGGGFGMVVLDLGDIPTENARRVPLTSWFRFRRAVEPTATVLLVLERESCAKTCASLVVRLQRTAVCTRDAAPATQTEFQGWKILSRAEPAIPPLNPVSHAALLRGMQLHAEMVRSWTQRKPMHSVGACFELQRCVVILLCLRSCMFACIYIPDFPVAAIVRAEPLLRDHAVAVLEGKPPQARVVALNEKARLLGMEIGMTKLQAAIFAAAEEDAVAAKIDPKKKVPQIELASRRAKAQPKPIAATLRQRSPAQEESSHAALLDVAHAFTPRVEDTHPDRLLLDLDGLERLYGSATTMARELASRVSTVGLECNIGVAANPDAAMHAACGFSGITVIPAGEETRRLGVLPITVLLNSFDIACGNSLENSTAARECKKLRAADTRHAGTLGRAGLPHPGSVA